MLFRSNEEIEREQESVKRDTEVVQQQIRIRLIENQEQLLRLSREVSIRAVNPEQFMRQASDFVRARPEVLGVSWVQADATVRASRTAMSLPLSPSSPDADDLLDPKAARYDPVHDGKEPQAAFQQVREQIGRAHV